MDDRMARNGSAVDGSGGWSEQGEFLVWLATIQREAQAHLAQIESRRQIPRWLRT